MVDVKVPLGPPHSTLTPSSSLTAVNWSSVVMLFELLETTWTSKSKPGSGGFTNVNTDPFCELRAVFCRVVDCKITLQVVSNPGCWHVKMTRFPGHTDSLGEVSWASITVYYSHVARHTKFDVWLMICEKLWCWLVVIIISIPDNFHKSKYTEVMVLLGHFILPAARGADSITARTTPRTCMF